MKIILALLGTVAITGMMAQESRTITGRITDGKVPLTDVKIYTADNAKSTFTDTDGKYAIEAIPGDVLYYNYTGMKEYKIRVEDVTQFLNLIMIPDIQELDEVTVTKRGRKSQEELAMEYRYNPDLIRTAFGIIDARTAPGRVRIVGENDIMPIGLCILDVVRNRFAGVRAVGNCQNGGYIVMRGIGSVGNPRVAIYDVDGQIFSTAPIWIDVNNIKRMAIISSLAFNVRYGSFGGGGVIVINTVAGQAAISKGQDMARLRNNYIEDEIPDESELSANAPTYLNELEATSQFDEAIEVYKTYRSPYNASPYFFMDAYVHFSKIQGGAAQASQILAEQLDRNAGNPVLLKGWAYILEEQGQYSEALEVYKEVFILRPHYSQSYLDLARAYRANRQYGRAASIFARFKYLVEEGFLTESEEFKKVLQHESDNLLALDGRNIGQRVRNILTDPFVDGTTRVVFEWNDSEAEFELQFVNPGGQYYTWKHTYAANDALIADEKDNGYAIAEYVIDENLPGTWTVNAKYLGNKSLTPSYLKVTVFTSYGERDQQSQVRSFKLFLKGVNQRLFSFENPTRVSVK